jgi:large subunit ribosomal protein L21
MAKFIFTNKSLYVTMAFVNRTHKVKKRKSLRTEGGETLIRRCILMYAIIETGGKQYRVQEGDVVFVEKLNAEVDTNVELTDVIAVNKDGNLVVGTPVVDGAKVVAKVLKQGKARKVVVFKYKPKKDSRKKRGHRQPYTKLQIEKIEA